jgi:septal ring factor EnvC (AmiA/AmiB activator)
MGDNDLKESCQAKESERRLNNIDETIKDYGARIGEVETKTVIYNEQIKTIFNALQEIKLNLKELQRTVDLLEKRPADLTLKIFIGVMTSLITALLMLGLKFLR